MTARATAQEDAALALPRRVLCLVVAGEMAAVLTAVSGLLLVIATPAILSLVPGFSTAVANMVLLVVLTLILILSTPVLANWVLASRLWQPAGRSMRLAACFAAALSLPILGNQALEVISSMNVFGVVLAAHACVGSFLLVSSLARRRTFRSTARGKSVMRRCWVLFTSIVLGGAVTAGLLSTTGSGTASVSALVWPLCYGAAFSTVSTAIEMVHRRSAMVEPLSLDDPQQGVGD
jgi:hypothetical protein